MNKQSWPTSQLRSAERGSAMVLAVLVLALLLGMGTSLLFMTDNEMKMGRTSLQMKRVFYLAEAGLEEARTVLFNLNGSGTVDFDDDLITAGGLDGIIDFNPDNLAPTYGADGEITGFTGYNDDVPVRPLTAFSTSTDPGQYLAFLTNDAVDTVTSTNDTNQRVMLTAVGVGRNRAMEVVQAIIEPIYFLPSVPPAALTLLGDGPTYDNGNSNAQAHDGNDCQGGGIPGLYAPILGTTDSNSRGGVQGAMNRPENFGSGPYTGTDTVGDLANPGDPIVSSSGLGTIDPLWTDCAALQALLVDLEGQANTYCDPAVSTCSVGSGAPGYLTFIDGDISIGPGTHQGILVVTGSLTMSGNSTWEGIVMVIGEGDWLRNGGGNGHVSGAAVVADIAGPNNIYGDSDDCTEGSAGLGSATYHVNGGGNSEVYYCTSHINGANPLLSFEVVEFLQR